MSDIDTGVNISISNDGLAGAKQISDALESIANSADRINQSLDSRVIDNYTKKMGKVAPTVQGVARGVGSSFMQAAQGDVIGGGATGLSSLLGAVKGHPLLTGIAGAGIGTVLAGNKLADIYKERAIPASRIAAMEGALGTDIEENDRALNEAMQETVDAVARYGKTFEEGAQSREAFLRAGGREFEASGAAAYSMAYGTDMSRLAGFTGQMQRYGQGRGLQTTQALLEGQGLSPAMFDEVLGGLQDTFTSFLNQGIVKPIEEIAESQQFFSRAGVTFQGALGAQTLQGMSQRVSGAAQLQTQDDIFAYRAAQQMADGGGIWETRSILEQGLTPELFKGLLSQYESFGLTQEQQMIKFSDYFGLSTAQTEGLFGLRGAKEQELAFGGLRPGTGATSVTSLVEAEENIKQGIIGAIGDDVLAIKANIVSVGADIVNGIQTLADIQRESKIEYLGEEDIGDSKISAKNRRELTKLAQKVTVGTSISNEMLMEAVGPMYEEYARSGNEITTTEKNAIVNAIMQLIQEVRNGSEKTTNAINGESVIYASGNANYPYGAGR